MENKEYVLLVEDEDSIRITLKEFLTRKGLDVLVASDGVGALKHLLDYEVKVIVSDYRMDILGGDYWVRFLDRYCPHKKVIITSGFLRPEFEVPFEVVYKPFEYADLAEKIIALLEE